MNSLAPFIIERHTVSFCSVIALQNFDACHDGEHC